MLIRTVGREYFLLELIETYRPIIGSGLAGRVGERTLQSLLRRIEGQQSAKDCFLLHGFGFLLWPLSNRDRQASSRDVATL